MRSLVLALLVTVVTAFSTGTAFARDAPSQRARLVPRPAPAELQTPRVVRTLASGSYCVRASVCVDKPRPEYRTNLPRVTLHRGEVVRFVLGFQPTVVTLSIDGVRYSVPPWRTIPWRVRGAGGTAELFARWPGGHATYVSVLRIPPKRS